MGEGGKGSGGEGRVGGDDYVNHTKMYGMVTLLIATYSLNHLVSVTALRERYSAYLHFKNRKLKLNSPFDQGNKLINEGNGI